MSHEFEINSIKIYSNLHYRYFQVNLQYSRETQNTFKQRISQHLDDIYNFIPFRRKFDKEVAVHFNLKGHNYLNDFKCAIYKDKLNDSLKRKSVEMDLINFLNKFHSTCINIKTEKNIFNTLCFI